MAKIKTAYVCSNCGQESTKWIGKCPSCGEWNTFKEIHLTSTTNSSNANGLFRNDKSASEKNRPVKLRDIPTKDDPRIDMHDAELNRVLGGGLVAGSIVLLGGEPGIGKSTLTLQTILNIHDKRYYMSAARRAHISSRCVPNACSTDKTQAATTASTTSTSLRNFLTKDIRIRRRTLSRASHYRLHTDHSHRGRRQQSW